MAISPVLGKLTHMQYKYAHIGVTCTFTYTHTNIRRIHAPILQYCKIAIAPRCAASDVCVSNKKISQTIVAKINLPNVWRWWMVERSRARIYIAITFRRTTTSFHLIQSNFLPSLRNSSYLGSAHILCTSPLGNIRRSTHATQPNANSDCLTIMPADVQHMKLLYLCICLFVFVFVFVCLYLYLHTCNATLCKFRMAHNYANGGSATRWTKSFSYLTKCGTRE